MNKFNYVSLLILALTLSACNQNNIRNSNDQTLKVDEQLSDKPIQENKAEDKEVDDDDTLIAQDDTVVLPDDATKVEPEEPVNKLNDKVETSEDTNVSTDKVVDEPEPELIKKVEPKVVKKPEAKITEPKIVEKVEIPLTTISGKINLNTDAIKYKDVNIESTVVYFKPTGYSGTGLKKENHVIASQNKRFEPSVLAIQKGSSVTFPNMDRILHNVFSVSNVQQFDLGLYSAGKEKTVTFDNAGIIYVHCNVHHSMQADILVLDTPFYTNVDNQGKFSLKNLPSQSGELFMWHPRAKLEQITISENSKIDNVNKTIDIVRKKIPKHLNKFGAPYRPVRGE